MKSEFSNISKSSQFALVILIVFGVASVAGLPGEEELDANLGREEELRSFAMEIERIQETAISGIDYQKMLEELKLRFPEQQENVEADELPVRNVILREEDFFNHREFVQYSNNVRWATFIDGLKDIESGVAYQRALEQAREWATEFPQDTKEPPEARPFLVPPTLKRENFASSDAFALHLHEAAYAKELAEVVSQTRDGVEYQMELESLHHSEWHKEWEVRKENLNQRIFEIESRKDQKE